MAAGAAGATLEAAAVETAVAIDAVVAAEGGSADRRALRVGRARPAEGDIAATSTATNRLTDTLGAIETATTLGSSRAATALIAAAVQRAIAGDPIVVAEDRASHLAAFARLGALPTEPDGAAAATRGSADSIRAEQTTAADGVSIARAAIVVAAVQDAVGVDPVRGADRRPRRLAALSGLRAFRAEWPAHRSGCSCRDHSRNRGHRNTQRCSRLRNRHRLRCGSSSTDRRRHSHCQRRPSLRHSGCIARRGALRPRSESARCRRSRRGATAGAIHAEEIRAALNVVRACAAGIAAAVARAVGGNAVAGADDRSAGLATFAGRRALGAERPPTGAATAAARAADADRSAAAMEVRGARSPGVAATIELSVANNAVVAADDGAAGLAALGVGAERGTLPTERNRVLCPCQSAARRSETTLPLRGGKSLEHAAPGRSGGDRPR